MSEKTIRALSVRQPWASMIAEGRKTIEVRTWLTHYRGPLAIVAGLARDRDGIALHGFADAPRGVLIAVAELVDVRPMTEDDEEAACVACSDDAYAWVLRNVSALVPPPPCRGAQGLFHVETRMLRAYQIDPLPAGPVPTSEKTRCQDRSKVKTRG